MESLRGSVMLGASSPPRGAVSHLCGDPVCARSCWGCGWTDAQVDARAPPDRGQQGHRPSILARAPPATLHLTVHRENGLCFQQLRPQHKLLGCFVAAVAVPPVAPCCRPRARSGGRRFLTAAGNRPQSATGPVLPGGR